MSRTRLVRQVAGLGAVAAASGLLLRRHASPADTATPRSRVTVVVRLPPGEATGLHDALAPLRAAAPRQHHPAPGSLHVTVGTPPLHDDGAPDLGAIAAVAARHRPFPARLHGLRPGPGTVLLRAFVPGGELAALRRDLRRGLPAGERLRAAVRDALLAGAGHVTVLRLREPADGALRAALRSLRHLDAGEAELAWLEVARTDRLLSEGGTDVLARYPLRA